MRIALALLLLALWAPSWATAAGLQWQQIATAVGPVVGDGRSVAWQSSSTALELVGPNAPPTAVAVPAGCTADLRAVGGRELLVACARTPGTGRSPVYAIVDPAHGVTATIDLETRFPYPEPNMIRPFALGRRWIRASVDDYHVSDEVYIDRFSKRVVDAHKDPFGPRHYLDLDSARLGHRLCRPLRRRPFPGAYYPDVFPTYDTVQVAGRWALEGGERLLRCGSSSHRDLRTAIEGQLGSGWVTWLAAHDRERTLHARRLADGRSFAWPLRLDNPLGLDVVHTAGALYASTPIGPDYAPSGYRIFAAALPSTSARP